MSKLSIIVTVYNKEKYLGKCIDSCLQQKGVKASDYDILIVNDGSKDNSLSIIEKYANLHGNIKVIDQSNQGLSMARNNGVDISTADYVWFVDSDDWISDNSVSLIIKAAETSPDIIPIYAKTEGIDAIRNKIPASVKNGQDILLSNQWTHCGPFYIYRRAFLLDNNLHYMPGIYHEDSELTPRLLYYAKSAVVVPEILYNVFVDPNSITQKSNPKRAFDNLLVADSLYGFSNSFVMSKKLKNVYNYHIAILLNNALSRILEVDNSHYKEFNLALYEKRYLFESLNSSDIKYRFEILLFRLFPKKYVGVYRFLKRK